MVFQRWKRVLCDHKDNYLSDLKKKKSKSRLSGQLSRCIGGHKGNRWTNIFEERGQCGKGRKGKVRPHLCCLTTNRSYSNSLEETTQLAKSSSGTVPCWLMTFALWQETPKQSCNLLREPLAWCPLAHLTCNCCLNVQLWDKSVYSTDVCLKKTKTKHF